MRTLFILCVTVLCACSKPASPASGENPEVVVDAQAPAVDVTVVDAPVAATLASDATGA